MDEHGVALLDNLIANQLVRLRVGLDKAATGRAASFLAFVAQHLGAVDSERVALVAQLQIEADPSGRRILGRRLLRIRQLLDAFHILVFLYGPDVGRRDLPVGLLHLVDALLEGMVGSGDAVVHLDQSNMYSTGSMTVMWSPLSKELNVTYTGEEPIVFNLPGLDPTNMLLSPILAHEVGHTVLSKFPLITDALAASDVRSIEQHRDSAIAILPSVTQHDWQLQFRGWCEELICDALATALTGPSMLFASAAFLPAPDLGQLGTHPYPADRLRITLDQLEAGAWKPLIGEECAAIVDWLDGLAAAPAAYGNPLEASLRESTKLIAPAIVAVAEAHIDARLQADDFAVVWPSLRDYLDAGIPPAQVSTHLPSPWQIVLGAWLFQLRRHGSDATGIARAVADSEFNRLILKSVEMARVLQLWEE